MWLFGTRSEGKDKVPFRDPDRTAAVKCIMEADKLSCQGRYAEAINATNRAMQKQKGFWLPYRTRGEIHAKQGHYDAAIADLTESIRLGMAENGVYQLRAYCHFKNKNYQLVVDDCNKALEYSPGSSVALEYRARAYGMSKQYAEAKADLDRLISMKPQNTDYYILRIDCNEKSGNKLAVEEDGKTVLPMLYRDAWVLCNIARQPQSAIPYCNVAVDLKPDDWKPYFFRATTYQQMGNVNRSMEEFRKARSLGWNGKFPPTGELFNPDMLTSQVKEAKQRTSRICHRRQSCKRRAAAIPKQSPAEQVTKHTLPCQPNIARYTCNTMNYQRAWAEYNLAKQSEKEGKIFEAGQHYANAIYLSKGPLTPNGLVEDYDRFLQKASPAKAASK